MFCEIDKIIIQIFKGTVSIKFKKLGKKDETGY